MAIKGQIYDVTQSRCWEYLWSVLKLFQTKWAGMNIGKHLMMEAYCIHLVNCAGYLDKTE
jgi:hypothetical protein